MSSNTVNEFLIFQSWQDSDALILFRSDATTHSISLWVRIASIDADSGEVVCSVEGERRGKITLRLKGAPLVYRDSAESDSETDPALTSAFQEAFVCRMDIAIGEQVFVLVQLRVED